MNPRAPSNRRDGDFKRGCAVLRDQKHRDGRRTRSSPDGEEDVGDDVIARPTKTCVVEHQTVSACPQCTAHRQNSCCSPPDSVRRVLCAQLIQQRKQRVDPFERSHRGRGFRTGTHRAAGFLDSHAAEQIACSGTSKGPPQTRSSMSRGGHVVAGSMAALASAAGCP